MHAYCSTFMMLHIGALQSLVVKGRQVFRHSTADSYEEVSGQLGQLV